MRGATPKVYVYQPHGSVHGLDPERKLEISYGKHTKIEGFKIVAIAI